MERRMTASVRACTGDLQQSGRAAVGGYGSPGTGRTRISLPRCARASTRGQQGSPGPGWAGAAAVRSARGRASVLGAGQLPEQVVTALPALGVLLHHLAEERGDVVQAGVLGVPDVLAVVVTGLERVVLDGDQVERDVGETGLTSGHGNLLDESGCDPRLMSAHAGRETGRSPSGPVGGRRLGERSAGDVPAAGLVGRR